ncbi:P-loop containing nucleoside triphosphate hydrolase protein, partial [Xylaria arbuscula]
HILGPLSAGGFDFAKPLREYLTAYCLRRNENCLTLPSSSEEKITLQLSSQERGLYNRILDNTRKQIDSLISKRGTASCSKLFAAMLKMRMLCNLGTFSSATGSLGQSHLKQGCDRCSAPDEDTSMLLESFAFCPDCKRPLQQSSPLPDSIDREEDSADHNLHDAGTMMHKATKTLILHGNQLPRAGFSTKLHAVVDNVSRSGPDSKNIIFSYWTSTLDVLFHLLTRAEIPCCQVDGRTTYTERSKNLTTFKNDPRVSVLLMSIETGAVGLNLTIANKVHLVEPQWNPAVEEQAVARALRMGQTREVTVFRYMVENTVEQNIIDLQRKKKQLAKFTFDTGETLSGAFEDLRSVFDIGSS